MAKEAPKFPCLFNPSRNCDCSLLPENVKVVNNLGKERGLRGIIQREGYDPVTPALIKHLITNPNGWFYTELFEKSYLFSPKMRDIRKNILEKWKRKVIHGYGRDPNKIPCDPLREYLLADKT